MNDTPIVRNRDIVGILALAFAFLALGLCCAGCGAGYSIKVMHMPSTKTALDTIYIDSMQANRESLTRYDRLYDQVLPFIPAIVHDAQRRGYSDVTIADTAADLTDERNEFRKSTALTVRAATMANELKKSLAISDDPPGNLDMLPYLVGGIGAGAAAAAAF